MAARGDLAREFLRVGIPLTLWKAADLAWPAITGTEDNGDHFIALGTNTIVLRGNEPNGDTQTDVSWAQVYLPPDYVGGSDLTFYISVEVATGGSADTKNVDLSAYRVNTTTGAVGSDICATGVQTTAATATEYGFTVTGATLAPGDCLNLKVTTVAGDATTHGQASIWGTSLGMYVR